MIANPMTARESFDTFYTRKLDALKIELKAVIRMGIPYTVSATYACVSCQGRLFLHTCEGQIHCMLCQLPTLWPREVQTCVATILESYPSLEASHQEWEAFQSKPTPRELKGKARIRGGDVELGKRIRAARIERGLSQRELARMLHKKNGSSLSYSAVQNYELGEAIPSAHVMEQLQEILGLEVGKNE